jgi:hypothetical protein
VQRSTVARESENEAARTVLVFGIVLDHFTRRERRAEVLHLDAALNALVRGVL